LAPLVELTTLELDDAPSPPLDLLPLRKLRACFLKWHKKYPPEFFGLPALRDVTLEGYSEVTCTQISKARGLTELELERLS